MMNKGNPFQELKSSIAKEKEIAKELTSFSHDLKKAKRSEEKNMILSHINSLRISLKKVNENVLEILGNLFLAKQMEIQEKSSEQIPSVLPKNSEENFLKEKSIPVKLAELSEVDKRVIKTLKQRDKKIIKRTIEKPSAYVKTASRIFSKFSMSLIDKKTFPMLKRNLAKANMQFVPSTYLSIVFFTVLLSSIVAVFAFLFFLFFNLGPTYPFISGVSGSLFIRTLKIFWILFVIPVAVFLMMYFYPSVEKKSAEERINQELPFAAIHMSAVSGSLMDPSKIFNIIIATGEYPHLQKEFTKLINEINIYGYNLVSALRNTAYNSPSNKLAELFNGMATTITSGGDLSEFFEKRAQTLLFEYRIDREKRTKSAETFMDIYISVVIAAPMILMLLLMMMKVSGLGISLSSSMITLITVLGVSLINIFFITFLHLKQPPG